MKLYNKKPLYTNEGGIFKKTKKFMYIPTKQGRAAAVVAGTLSVLVLVGVLISVL